TCCGAERKGAADANVSRGLRIAVWCGRAATFAAPHLRPAGRGRDDVDAIVGVGPRPRGCRRPLPLGVRAHTRREGPMIRKLASGEYRLYSRKVNPKTGRRRNLGTFKTRAAAEKHERAVQFFKRRG